MCKVLCYVGSLVDSLVFVYYFIYKLGFMMIWSGNDNFYLYIKRNEVLIFFYNWFVNIKVVNVRIRFESYVFYVWFNFLFYIVLSKYNLSVYVYKDFIMCVCVCVFMLGVEGEEI